MFQTLSFSNSTSAWNLFSKPPLHCRVHFINSITSENPSIIRQSQQCSLYEGSLKSSWTRLITPSRNFVELRWRPLFRSTSLGTRCTSYNAPHTSRNRKRSNKTSPRTFQAALVLAKLRLAQNFFLLRTVSTWHFTFCPDTSEHKYFYSEIVDSFSHSKSTQDIDKN
jgi:hypothetical protein